MISAQLTGIFPRSRKLVETTRNYDKGLIDMESLRERIREDAMEVIQLQRDCGLGCLLDGMFLWQDIFRPFTESLEGMSPGPLVRWFDNNTFFRRPIIESMNELVSGEYLGDYILEDLLPENTCRKVVLPGPYTFARLSSRGADRETILFLAEVLANSAAYLEKHGFSVVQFNEPAMVYYRIGKEELQNSREAYEVLRGKLNARVILHTYFGDAAPILHELLDFPVDYVGIDFFATEYREIKDFSWDRGMLCGCFDARNSYIEPVEMVEKLIEEIRANPAPRDLIIAPNCDLEFLPRDVAMQKVRRIGEVLSNLGGE